MVKVKTVVIILKILDNHGYMGIDIVMTLILSLV